MSLNVAVVVLNSFAIRFPCKVVLDRAGCLSCRVSFAEIRLPRLSAATCASFVSSLVLS